MEGELKYLFFGWLSDVGSTNK